MTWSWPLRHEPPAGSVRAKIVGLTVIAAVPVVILGGVIASQLYGDAGRAALQTALMLHATTMGRYEAATSPSAALPPGSERDWRDGALPGSPADPGRLHSATWLVSPAGVLAAVRGPADWSVPLPGTLRVLLRSPQAALLDWSAEGRRVAYASTMRPDGWRLITEYDATSNFDRAADALWVRLGLLGLLMAMGLAAVIVGVGITFGEPLRRIATAVSRWQGGGPFTPGPLAGAPREVRELASSFGEAVTALRQREAELVQSQERQDLLVLEIHHRVKNNLQIVASLLNLQASRIRLPEARAEFQAARDRVRALATLHRHLYSDGELHTINMRSFLVELCGQLFQALGESVGDDSIGDESIGDESIGGDTPRSVAGDRIVLTIEAPELRMTSDQAVPLALIVTEAVTNSVKYAFPDGRRGHISVRLTADGEQLDLEIEDDGIGILSGRAEMASGTSDGIGRQLIRGFARQLGASLAVREGPGTRYAVRMGLKTAGPSLTPEPLDAA